MFPLCRQIWILGILLFSLGQTPWAHGAPVTPSHVYLNAREVSASIGALREARGIRTPTRRVPLQVDKIPLQVYGKGLEVLEKIARAQGPMGMTPAPVPDLPSFAVTPGDVLGLTRTLLAELDRLREAEGLPPHRRTLTLDLGKTPSDVYGALWHASFLMDGITEPIRPGDVYNNALRIQGDIALVAADLGVALPGAAAPLRAGSVPADVATEGMHCLYRLAEWSLGAGMEPLEIQELTTTHVSPSEVYDVTNLLLVELSRVRRRLGISAQTPRPDGVDPSLTPSDVLRVMEDAGAALDALLAAQTHAAQGGGQ